jgi:hypothetical protein
MISGAKLIRIDHTQLNNLREHIEAGLQSTDQLYLSTPSMYTWLTDPVESLIDPDDLKKHVPNIYDKLFGSEQN